MQDGTLTDTNSPGYVLLWSRALLHLRPSCCHAVLIPIYETFVLLNPDPWAQLMLIHEWIALLNAGTIIQLFHRVNTWDILHEIFLFFESLFSPRWTQQNFQGDLAREGMDVGKWGILKEVRLRSTQSYTGWELSKQCIFKGVFWRWRGIHGHDSGAVKYHSSNPQLLAPRLKCI